MELLTVTFNLNEAAIQCMLKQTVPFNVDLSHEESKQYFGSLKLTSRLHDQSPLPSHPFLKRGPTNGTNREPMSAKHPRMTSSPVSSKPQPMKSSRQMAVPVLNRTVQSQGSVVFGKDLDGNFICPICKNSFSRQSHANRHFISVHNKVSYKCELCVYSSRKDHLKIHIMKAHGLSESMAKMMAMNSSHVQL